MFIIKISSPSKYTRRFSEVELPLGLLMLLWLSFQAPAASLHPDVHPESTQSNTVAWSSSSAEHVYGLPGAKAKERGSLAITATDLRFAGNAGISTIPLQSIMAVSAGNQRVELWGVKGRILRMAIPEGGGLVAATFMHHRVDMLTVEFTDSQRGYHGAVFFLPANEAQRAVENIAVGNVVHREPAGNTCEDSRVDPRSVRVSVPTRDQIDVPAAYRALVYEHLIERLRRLDGIESVYRDGEEDTQHGCPQYSVQLSITGFKPGSQVARASMGPVGMFAGTTELVLNLAITDAGGKPHFHDQIKATVRGESESTNVADGIAKKLVKQFTVAQTTMGDVGLP